MGPYLQPFLQVGAPASAREVHTSPGDAKDLHWSETLLIVFYEEHFLWTTCIIALSSKMFATTTTCLHRYDMGPWVGGCFYRHTCFVDYLFYLPAETKWTLNLFSRYKFQTLEAKLNFTSEIGFLSPLRVKLRVNRCWKPMFFLSNGLTFAENLCFSLAKL